eukprot:TRINITY_DN3957_c1_g1_i6.p1 TRINITY_DN3957_c1_g1~~TRINITY_DN3957_c1_g1_i6.p1  ORF type:complete len:189 (+),score=31.89 TRINITY_DN3957_c1_g1_i6:173-739(+)
MMKSKKAGHCHRGTNTTHFCKTSVQVLEEPAAAHLPKSSALLRGPILQFQISVQISPSKTLSILISERSPKRCAPPFSSLQRSSDSAAAGPFSIDFSERSPKTPLSSLGKVRQCCNDGFFDTDDGFLIAGDGFYDASLVANANDAFIAIPAKSNHTTNANDAFIAIPATSNHTANALHWWPGMPISFN